MRYDWVSSIFVFYERGGSSIGNILVPFFVLYPFLCPFLFPAFFLELYHSVNILLCTAYFVIKWRVKVKRKAWSYRPRPLFGLLLLLTEAYNRDGLYRGGS